MWVRWHARGRAYTLGSGSEESSGAPRTPSKRFRFGQSLALRRAARQRQMLESRQTLERESSRTADFVSSFGKISQGEGALFWIRGEVGQKQYAGRSVGGQKPWQLAAAHLLLADAALRRWLLVDSAEDAANAAAVSQGGTRAHSHSHSQGKAQARARTRALATRHARASRTHALAHPHSRVGVRASVLVRTSVRYI
eukprot:2984694-Pleurochrysis_carterae.AAC.1